MQRDVIFVKKTSFFEKTAFFEKTTTFLEKTTFFVNKMTSVGIERLGLFRPRGVGRARPLPRPDLILLTTRRSSRTALFVYADVQRIDYYIN